ncbi:MAG TPA: hypothetical protein VF026_28375 [Ktedonobacteraceae bacterium]
MVTLDVNTPPQTAGPKPYAEIEKCIRDVRDQAKHTSCYMAALLSTGNTVPIFAAFMSVLFYITLSHSPGFTLWATAGGSLIILVCWLLIGFLYKRFTAVDRANAASYEQLLNRLQQAAAWYETLTQKHSPKNNSLYAIGLQEISTSLCTICKSLQTRGPSWISATGYTSAWKLMHRVDEAFIEIEPVEAVIHNALHDEMSLQDSTLTNREDLLNKLRRAVKKLAPEAAVYLNQQPPQAQQPPQDDQTKHNDPQTTLAAMQNGENPNENDCTFSNAIDSATQARTIIYEVRTTLHHFRDDRWDKLIRVRNQLMKMTLVTGLLLYAFVEFAIMMNVGTETLKAATILFFVGGLVGLFSRLYDQSKTDTSIEDFRLATARLIAAPLYSGLSAIGGVLVVKQMFDLNVTSILIAAAFGLTPSLFTTAIQKEADQYKTDLKSTTAPTGEKRKNNY